MNKADLIAKLSASTGTTKKAAEEFVAALADIIVKTVKAGEDVKIPGLGAFKLVHRAARTGVNPQTKQPMKIAASKAPAFRASATFKAAVN
ncbi:MAG: HU family DNA-binding protein [Oscillospiraceae bacterium]|nr:HU family DNA-binding protein [Oscillospiraceae bacterium]